MTIQSLSRLQRIHQKYQHYQDLSPEEQKYYQMCIDKAKNNHNYFNYMIRHSMFFDKDKKQAKKALLSDKNVFDDNTFQLLNNPEIRKAFNISDDEHKKYVDFACKMCSVCPIKYNYKLLSKQQILEICTNDEILIKYVLSYAHVPLSIKRRILDIASVKNYLTIFETLPVKTKVREYLFNLMLKNYTVENIKEKLFRNRYFTYTEMQQLYNKFHNDMFNVTSLHILDESEILPYLTFSDFLSFDEKKTLLDIIDSNIWIISNNLLQLCMQTISFTEPELDKIRASLALKSLKDA